MQVPAKDQIAGRYSTVQAEEGNRCGRVITNLLRQSGELRGQGRVDRLRIGANAGDARERQFRAVAQSAGARRYPIRAVEVVGVQDRNDLAGRLRDALLYGLSGTRIAAVSDKPK